MKKTAGADPLRCVRSKFWKDWTSNHISAETTLCGKKFVQPVRRGHLIIVKEGDEVNGPGFRYGAIPDVSDTATFLDKVFERTL